MKHRQLDARALMRALAMALILVMSEAPFAVAQPAPPYRVFLPAASKSEQVLTLTASQDAFVFEGGPDVNTGGEIFLLAGNDQSEEDPFGISRSLIAFQLPLPVGGTVRRAIFRVYYSGYADFPDEPRTVELYAVASGWQETWVKWSNQPSRGALVGSATIAANNDFRYIEFDITPLVSGWSTYEESDYGLLLAGPEAAGSDWSYRVFDSSEGAHPPQLVLTLG